MRTTTVILDELADMIFRKPDVVHYILCVDTTPATWIPIPEYTFNSYLNRIHTFTEQMNLKLQTHNATFTISNKVPGLDFWSAQ